MNRLGTTQSGCPNRMSYNPLDHEKTKTFEVKTTSWIPWRTGQDALRDEVMRQAQCLVAQAAGSKENIVQRHATARNGNGHANGHANGSGNGSNGQRRTNGRKATTSQVKACTRSPIARASTWPSRCKSGYRHRPCRRPRRRPGQGVDRRIERRGPRTEGVDDCTSSTTPSTLATGAKWAGRL